MTRSAKKNRRVLHRHRELINNYILILILLLNDAQTSVGCRRCSPHRRMHRTSARISKTAGCTQNRSVCGRIMSDAITDNNSSCMTDTTNNVDNHNNRSTRFIGKHAPLHRRSFRSGRAVCQSGIRGQLPYVTLSYLTLRRRRATAQRSGPMHVPESELTLRLLNTLGVFSRLQEWVPMFLS